MGHMPRLSEHELTELQRAEIEMHVRRDGPDVALCVGLSMAHESGLEGDDALAFALALDEEYGR